MAITLGNCSNCCGGNTNDVQTVFAFVPYVSLARSVIANFPSTAIAGALPTKVYLRWDEKVTIDGAVYYWSWSQSDVNGNVTTGLVDNRSQFSIGDWDNSTTVQNDTYDGDGMLTERKFTEWNVPREHVMVTTYSVSNAYSLADAVAKAMALLALADLINPLRTYPVTYQPDPNSANTTTTPVHLAYQFEINANNWQTGTPIQGAYKLYISVDTAGNVLYGVPGVNGAPVPGSTPLDFLDTCSGAALRTTDINPIWDGNLWVWKRAARHSRTLPQRGDNIYARDYSATPEEVGPLLKVLVFNAVSPINPPMLAGENIFNPSDVPGTGTTNFGYS